ncbi:MAG: 50S ribosomal protein L15 [Anaerolinea sp.]|nr:50S ribosomal protein L15 [Anaerolinea sp.]
MRLHDLKPNPGAKKSRKRLGRGISAGQGKTSGRGTKGQSSRSGEGPRLYHQGGNLPFFRRLPFMRGEGFTPINRVEYSEVNLENLNRFSAGSEITPEVLFEAGFVRKANKPVVVLGNGEINIALKVRVHRVSKSAKAKIEAAGGSVETL